MAECLLLGVRGERKDVGCFVGEGREGSGRGRNASIGGDYHLG